jgi:hypothetical protein
MDDYENSDKPDSSDQVCEQIEVANGGQSNGAHANPSPSNPVLAPDALTPENFTGLRVTAPA